MKNIKILLPYILIVISFIVFITLSHSIRGYTVIEKKENIKVSAGKGNFTVHVKGVQPNRGGVVVVSIHTRDTGLESAYLVEVREVNGNTIDMQFKDLPFGEYMIFLTQDCNKNKKLDMTADQIPTEPFGWANRKSPPTGPPSFDDAAFIFDGTHSDIQVDLYSF